MASCFILSNCSFEVFIIHLLNDIIIPNLDDIAEDNYDLVFDTLNNALVAKFKEDYWDWVVDLGDWAFLNPILDDIKQVMKDNPEVLDDIIDSINDGGFDIKKVLKIIKPYKD